MKTAGARRPPLCLLLLFILIVDRPSTASAATFDAAHFHNIKTNVLRPQSSAQCPPTKDKPKASGMRVAHARGPCSSNATFSWETFMKETLDRDAQRLRPNADVDLESGRKLNTANYIATLGFGTPTKQFRLTVDTGSDITWMQCQPCDPNSCYSQVDPIFDPKSSSSYTPLSCSSPLCNELSQTENVPRCLTATGRCRYQARYGDGSETSGDFSEETVTVGTDIIKNFPFGCGHDNSGLFRGSAGLLGLGRGSLAFPARTRALYGEKFSYCLPDFSNVGAEGTLSMGPQSIPRGATFTPLLGGAEAASYYMVGLEAVSVGRFQIQLAVSRSVVDSGTVISRLMPDVYEAVASAFEKQTVGLPLAPGFSILEKCYDLSKVAEVRLPRIFLHYAGKATVEVNAVGLLAPVKEDLSQVCLAFAAESDELGFNIIGNFQQQRTRVAYDNSRRRLGFAAEQCSAPR